MSKLLSYLFQRLRKRWRILFLVLGIAVLLGAVFWALTQIVGIKRAGTWTFVVIWLVRFVLGIGAGYAALRLWDFRHHPVIGRVGLYINGFIIEAATAVVLLFVAQGVKLTWKFSLVMFIGAFLGDMVRAPLIIYLIKGPRSLPTPILEPKASDEMPLNWVNTFRDIVKEEVEKLNQVNKERP